jgi:hypothetical protein
VEYNSREKRGKLDGRKEPKEKVKKLCGVARMREKFNEFMNTRKTLVGNNSLVER